jgi:hypothetical protein
VVERIEVLLKKHIRESKKRDKRGGEDTKLFTLE